VIAARRVQLALSVYSVVAFAVLWAGVIAAVAGAWLPADAWGGFTGLGAAVQLVLVVVATPIVLALWAWGAALPGAVLIAVAIGLGIWTLAAVASLRKAIGRRLAG
jgi:hypothetical protein